MNIWDSVHRGLEKASQEAARIARIQRLRFTIDQLSRQLNTQQQYLVTRAMEVFTAGQMTQSELLPICQEMAGLQQQLEQAQHELKTLQTQGHPTPPQSGAGAPSAPPDVQQTPLILGAESASVPPPPNYHMYTDETLPVPTPPPPPGIEPETVSKMETLEMSTASQVAAQPTEQQRFCANCHAEIVTGHAYCSNCGHPVEGHDIAHLPTVRAGAPDPHAIGQKTVREETAQADAQEAADMNAAQPTEPQEKVQIEPASSPSSQSSETEGGE